MRPPDGAVDLRVVRRFVDLAVEALGAAREEIDTLNVYPVPDGDTGTNLYLTVVAARDALEEAADAPVEVALAAFGRGALLGARGNSGVIMSEMLGAFGRALVARDPQGRTATAMADAMHAATEASYRAVGHPVEGTILSVARAASDAALARAEDDGARGRDVVAAAAAGAREALADTTGQLAALGAAGVVDAGGRGLSVLLDAAETALTGRRPTPVTTPRGRHLPVLHQTHAEGAAQHPMPSGDLSPEGPSYEVMYLLDAEAAAVDALRGRLDALGDSLVVVGGEGLWNVHVHVDDVGAAIEAGIEAGRPHRVRVTHFAEQVAEASAARQAAPSGRTGRAVVAVAAGPGLEALFEEAGALVVPGGAGRRPATADLLEAVRRSGAAEAVVLPNDETWVQAAHAAAATAETDLGVRVAVVPTVAQVQGLAALAVHEPGRAFDADVLEMTATARHARHGAVSLAAERALTMAGWCEPGDVLGAVEGDFAIVGQDRHAVALEVLERLLGAGGELVTVVAGDGCEGLATEAAAWVDERYPHVDVVTYDGGQEHSLLLVSVE
ncbi:MAG: Dak phosphatase [Nocardioides sp.]|nr:Dak phosphatase [Nocardioides sp.]